MKIVLVHPPGANWMPGQRDVASTANRMAPIGLLSIAAVLAQNGHAVRVHDCLGPFARPGLDLNARLIADLTPDMVGFSVTTAGFLDACDMAVHIKQTRPEVKTIFGGVHVSAIGKRLLSEFPAIDFLCMGEGEQTMAELADGKPLDAIDGLIFRDNGGITANPPRRPLPDLDALPFPAYDGLKGFPEKYNLPLFSFIDAPGATMVTSRGCAYQCSFCDRSVFKKGYRANSAEYVFRHMRYLSKRFGVRHITIYDDLFTLDRARIETLCGMLAAAPFKLRFNCAVRAGHVDPALLKLLKAAGCLQVSLGIETADTDLLKTHKPGVNLKAVNHTVKMIQAAGLRVKGLFMMGLPGETAETIAKTSDFILSLGLDDMNMSKFTPFHGAPVWETIRDQGALEEDWRKMNCLNFVFVPKGIDSKQTLDHLYNTHVQRFYSNPAWRKKFTRRIWEHRRSLLYFLKHLPDFLSAMRTFTPR